jgi:hypothetical protein
MRTAAPCPNCSGGTLYARAVDSGGSHGPYLLPGLGAFLAFAQFQVVVCGDCGLTRLFADEGATAKLPSSRDWKRLGPAVA